MAKMVMALAYGDFPKHFPLLFQRLKKAYSEKTRHYHAWAHIEALRAHQQSVLAQLHDPVAVELAIYYHDAIYQPFSKTNEKDSARLLEKDLAGLVSENLIGQAAMLIEATAGHVLPGPLLARGQEETLSDCKYFLDMDISILGADPALYAWYEDAIRKEYEAVPEAMFCAGRAKILQSFLEREVIYFTPHFQEKFEAQARENLRAAIAALTP